MEIPEEGTVEKSGHDVRVSMLVLRFSGSPGPRAPGKPRTTVPRKVEVRSFDGPTPINQSTSQSISQPADHSSGSSSLIISFVDPAPFSVQPTMGRCRAISDQNRRFQTVVLSIFITFLGTRKTDGFAPVPYSTAFRHSQRQSSPHNDIPTMMAINDELESFDEGENPRHVASRSLAGPFVIETAVPTWSVYSIDSHFEITDDHDEHTKAGGSEMIPEGARATATLYKPIKEGTEEQQSVLSLSKPSPIAQLSCQVDNDEACVRVVLEPSSTAPTGLDDTLVGALSRVMIQHYHSARPEETSDISAVLFPESAQPVKVGPLHDDSSIRELFSALVDTVDAEFVEMVDGYGRPLGMVPRKLVHKLNLLHRGIGLVVAKDGSIQQPGRLNKMPDLYVHQRTATKRIFPSLYDQFVGGVSTAKEPARLTAAREVAEELGLVRALTDDTALSDPLFRCTVCTAYNRCVVTVFCYTFDSAKDSVSWQEEEVAWGSFVPYDDIEQSADLSIHRLLTSGKWPDLRPIDMDERIEKASDASVTEKECSRWDYVPDGLLVWEAWRKWFYGQGDK